MDIGTLITIKEYINTIKNNSINAKVEEVLIDILETLDDHINTEFEEMHKYYLEHYSE